MMSISSFIWWILVLTQLRRWHVRRSGEAGRSGSGCARGLHGVGIGLVLFVVWVHISSSSMCIETSGLPVSLGSSVVGVLVGESLVGGGVDMAGVAVSCIIGIVKEGSWFYWDHLGLCVLRVVFVHCGFARGGGVSSSGVGRLV